MRRADFDHVLAAAAEATGQDEFVVVGSQAILGTRAEAPDSLPAARRDHIAEALGRIAAQVQG